LHYGSPFQNYRMIDVAAFLPESSLFDWRVR
jgi:hypothetical protein